MSKTYVKTIGLAEGVNLITKTHVLTEREKLVFIDKLREGDSTLELILDRFRRTGNLQWFYNELRSQGMLPIVASPNRNSPKPVSAGLYLFFLEPAKQTESSDKQIC